MSEPTNDSVTVMLSPGAFHAPGIPAELAEKLNAPTAGWPRSRRQSDRATCHRCGDPATQQWPRHATPDEAEDWHAAREQHIRAHNDGRAEAEYISDRSDTVTLAVHGCDEHVVPEPHRTHDADCGGHGACQCGGDRG